ncbi:MAG: 3-demethylubiquinone-9 3-O-methyltransferase [Deltaproteobacteria bacterium]|nr:3-demethylubiquinone-9 3-O-methyltransferase [Deltaproteobacteria bacterium]
MVVDEGWFHRRRGLPRWERIGHPLDTLTIALCLGWLAVARDPSAALPVYVGLAIFSTLFVTKDEAVHARVCGAGEHWLHAILFALHPIVLAAFAVLWWSGWHAVILGQLLVTLGFLTYQVVYWNVRKPDVRDDRAVNNAWYAALGDRWYDACDTPIALLRAEARHRNPWIAGEIAQRLGERSVRVLDIGCGAGFLANDLAARGHRVAGLDAAEDNLAVARLRDATGSVTYQRGDAYALPYADASFDVVCALDLLEHVEDPARVIAEVARVLTPSGLFFFHTFNRTWLAHLIVIKGVEWFVRNTPKDLHVLRLFLTPAEVTAMCRSHDLELVALKGSRPRFRWPLWRMVLTGAVGDDFAFTFTRSTQLGFTGYARKS